MESIFSAKYRDECVWLQHPAKCTSSSVELLKAGSSILTLAVVVLMVWQASSPRLANSHSLIFILDLTDNSRNLINLSFPSPFVKRQFSARLVEFKRLRYCKIITTVDAFCLSSFPWYRRTRWSRKPWPAATPSTSRRSRVPPFRTRPSAGTPEIE
jgi:hypothetical protein